MGGVQRLDAGGVDFDFATFYEEQGVNYIEGGTIGNNLKCLYKVC